jgi:hypothetical protein
MQLTHNESIIDFKILKIPMSGHHSSHRLKVVHSFKLDATFLTIILCSYETGFLDATSSLFNKSMRRWQCPTDSKF